MALLQALSQAARQSQHVGSLQQLRCFAAAPSQLQLIKELRERTGAPMSDVKTALQAAGWDLGEACAGLMGCFDERKAHLHRCRCQLGRWVLPLLPLPAAAACWAGNGLPVPA